MTTAVLIDYIDQHRDRFGVEPICKVLRGAGMQIAPSSYYAAKTWKSIDDLEIAVAEYIDWFNHRRLHGEIGLVPPVEFEEQHYRHNPVATTVAASVESLY